MKKLQMIGIKFGRLSVMEEDGRLYSNRIAYKCRCDCGKFLVSTGENLRSGATKSCGCLRRELIIERSTIHGLAGSKTYRAWARAKERCYSESSPRYKHYGGRGIKMCAKWRYSFNQFLADMGECPKGLTLERKDVDGNYDPTNCVWASWEDQSNNKQCTRFVLLKSGDKESLKLFCTKRSLNYKFIHQRLRIAGFQPLTESRVLSFR